MRPVISRIYERNGKTYLLPVPARLRELIDCAHALKLKEEDDEKDVRVVGYRSLIGVVPDIDDHWFGIDETAGGLAKMSPEQLDVIKRMCAAFGLTYRDIGPFFTFLCDAKGILFKELCAKGVPMTEEGEKQSC